MANGTQLPIDEEKKRGGIGRLLKFLPGVLAAGATGFNPLLGVLAPTGQRESQRLSNELAREQIATARSGNARAADAAAAVKELPGVLAQQGPNRQPTNVNPVTGEQMSVPETLAKTGPERRTDEANLQGVLARIAPTQTAQSLITGERGLAGKLGAIEQSLGRPLTEEEVMRVAVPGGNTGVEDVIQMFQLEELIDDMRVRRKEVGDETRNTNEGIVDSIDGLLRAADANDALVGTFLESGGTINELSRVGAPFVARGASVIGADDFAGGLRDTITNYDKLVKETALLASATISLKNSAGVNITRAMQNLIEAGSASEKVSPGTNSAILGVTLQTLLRAADNQGLQINNRDAVEQRLQKLQGERLIFFTEQEAENAIRAGVLNTGDLFMINDEEQVVQ